MAVANRRYNGANQLLHHIVSIRLPEPVEGNLRSVPALTRSVPPLPELVEGNLLSAPLLHSFPVSLC
ncbi:MAG: hypothetical protein AAGF95_34840 [Chloroflexota bacterium]